MAGRKSRYDLARMEPRAADSLVCRHLVARLARFTAGTRTSLGLSESTDCVGISSHLRNDFGRRNCSF